MGRGGEDVEDAEDAEDAEGGRIGSDIAGTVGVSLRVAEDMFDGFDGVKSECKRVRPNRVVSIRCGRWYNKQSVKSSARNRTCPNHLIYPWDHPW